VLFIVLSGLPCVSFINRFFVYILIFDFITVLLLVLSLLYRVIKKVIYVNLNYYVQFNPANTYNMLYNSYIYIC